MRELIGKVITMPVLKLYHTFALYLMWRSPVYAESVPGEYSVKGDELLYLSVPEEMTVDEAHAFCGKIPGHRLAIIKTPQHREAILELLNSTGK